MWLSEAFEWWEGSGMHLQFVFSVATLKKAAARQTLVEGGFSL